MYIPVQMNCVPSFDMVRKSLCPPLSMNVTPLRSTVHAPPFWARCLFFQHVLSSPTHGPTKRPSSVHLCSATISAIVIRNISIAPVHHLVDDSSNISLGLASIANSCNVSESGSNANRFERACAYGLPTRLVQNAHRPYMLSSARCRAHVRPWDPMGGRYPPSFRSRILFPDRSRRSILRCPAGSGSGRVLLFLQAPGCREGRHYPVPRGAPVRHRAPLPEHIAIL